MFVVAVLLVLGLLLSDLLGAQTPRGRRLAFRPGGRVRLRG